MRHRRIQEIPVSPKFKKTDTLFQLLATQASFLVTAADRLSDVINASPADRSTLQQKLHEAEQGADEACHSVLKLINQSFVLPFDREDLYSLADDLDDVVDLIDEAGDNIVLYKPLTLPDGAKTQVELLQKCAQLTQSHIGNLASINENIREYWVTLNEIENQGDKLYRSMIAELFNGGTDALEVLKIKAVLDALEGALAAFEDLSSTVESIAIKES